MKILGVIYFVITLFSFFISKGQSTITSFSPASGDVGTTVTIIGTNFNPIDTNNIVYFGPTKAFVIHSDVSTLQVIVPVGANHQIISVTDLTTNLTSYSNKPFVVTMPFCSPIELNRMFNFSSGTSMCGIVTGDFDGNGRPDVVTIDQYTNSISVLLNSNSGNANPFDQRVDFATGILPISIATADFDGDGKLDIVTANEIDSTLSIFQNLCRVDTANFAEYMELKTDKSPIYVTIGDLDLDGKPDIVVVHACTNLIIIYRNISTLGHIEFDYKLEISGYSSPRHVAIGDINGDKLPELVVPNSLDDVVSVFENSSVPGVISFEPFVNFSTGTYPINVALGDLDEDTKLDIIVANYTNADSGSVSILRNLSDVSIDFADKINLRSGIKPNWVIVEDLNGDGKLDISLTNFGENSISLFNNRSLGNDILFGTKVDYYSGELSTCHTTCDYDCDGKIDIISICGSTDSISLYRNLQCSITSAIGLTEDNLVEIFPNPNNGKFSIDVSNADKYNQLVVTDINGRVRMTISIPPNTTINQEIELVGLDAGIYFVELKATNGKEVIKFIKN